MKKHNYKKGRGGEDIAKQYLVNRGFEFIVSNFEVDIGEIDLIMSDHDWLVFVEVKYKSDDHMGMPEEMINKRKISQVKRVAEIYLMKNQQMRSVFEKYRIDGVCILGSEIRYYKNLGYE
ncbi:YraN family protein [Candidatus Shapirobacteria bacterium]|nr:YraN family protein [Candidatus Shapirobacteria bacterium]